MSEFNLLDGYPIPAAPRIVAPNLRTIKHRLIASQRGFNFFDGDRNCGYGGFNYDGRWQPVATKIIEHYNVPNKGAILHLNCEKGFLLNDLLKADPTLNLVGTETSKYAIENSMEGIRDNIVEASANYLPFEDNKFDFVLGLGVIYIFTLAEAINVLKEIERVSKGNSFITLASFETEEEYFLFKDWTLLGALLFKKPDWMAILDYAGYTGDYYFTGAKTLNLIRK